MKRINILLKILIIIIIFNCQPTISENKSTDNSVERNDNACKVNINLTGSLQNPAWSADGKSILLTRFRNGYNTGPADLYIINLETKQIKPLVQDGYDNINLPGSAWNTNKIVFSSSRGDIDPEYDHDEIYLINENDIPGNEVKATERADLQAYEPSFSPGGDFIVFESHIADVETDGNIIKKDLSQAITAGFTELTATGDYRQPNWAPVGGNILFQKIVSDKWDIWIMNIDGSGQTQVTTSDGDNTDASFSPDGKNIIYSTDGYLDYANIYVIPVTGGTPKRLTFYNDGYDGAPSWSPDGKKAAFESCPGDPDESSGTKIWIIDIPAGF